jgi:hypothetical protein
MFILKKILLFTFVFTLFGSQIFASNSDDNLVKYKRLISETNEEVNLISVKDILQKLKKRELPSANAKSLKTRKFGLHGMEAPFVKAGIDSEKVGAAYELLARTGVERFRTGESFWHRLSENFSDYRELDYQASFAKKYGMDFMFVVGYPPSKFSVQPGPSTFKPEYENLYRKYIQQLIKRYKGIVKQVEIGNEVDYPNTWWTGGNPEMYVRDCRIVREEVKKIDPTIELVAFAATGSRTPSNGGPGGGQKFVRQAFDLGINNYVDKYSLHYVWPSHERKFTTYFRNELRRVGSSKGLIDSEDSGFTHPSDIIKVYSRSLFLYGYERVDYFLAQDYYENDVLFYSGLFDIKWNPKPRLLAYAAAVDGIKNNTLIGMAEPLPDTEAYILKRNVFTPKLKSKYSIIIWKNHKSTWTKNEPITYEQIKPNFNFNLTEKDYVSVVGIRKFVSGFNWKLDKIGVDLKSGHIDVSSKPIVILADELPNWKIITSEEWLTKKNLRAK